MKYITFENLNSFATKLADKITEKFAKKSDIPTSLPANGGNADTVSGHTVETNVPAGAVFTDTKEWSKIDGKPSTFAPATHLHTKSQISDFPSSMPANGGDSSTVNGHSVNADVPSNAKFTDTTYGNMTGATASAAGKAGLTPAPAVGAQGKYLRGDGTWQTLPNNTYSNFTGAQSSKSGKSGLVPAPAAGETGKYLKSDGTWADVPAAEAATDADIDNIIAGIFA